MRSCLPVAALQRLFDAVEQKDPVGYSGERVVQ